MFSYTISNSNSNNNRFFYCYNISFQSIKVLSAVLKKTFGNVLPDVDRDEKWGPLKISDKIRAKLAMFDTGSAIIERSMNSFAKFFEAVKKVDDRYQARQSESRSIAVDVVEVDEIDLAVSESQTLQARINAETTSVLEEVTQVRVV